MNIIYGRTGTGKSEYIYNKIKEEIDVCPKTYIITPEQFSFTAEKKLLEVLETGATTKVEVLSFERMAYRVIKETLGSNIKNISNSGKAILISKYLEENQKELNFLGKNMENVDLILTEIAEFKKHNITVEMLEKQVEKLNDKYLKLKLQDILLIYSKFQKKIYQNYIDENDLLTLLADNIEKSHLFDNSIFYIDEFSGFTKQEYLVITNILKIAKEVNITVCTDELRVTKSPEADIFYDNKQTIQTLKNITDIKKEIFLDKQYRYKNEELKHLEKNIFGIPFTSYEKNVENISLNVCKNQYEEIENVSKEIVKLVRDKGYRYKEIGVITKNLSTYASLCKAIFSEYEIPMFIDEKKDITTDIFVKYILSILDIFAKNWSYESVFNYLKTGIVNIDKIYELENYCLKWNIKGKKWYEKPWNYEEENNFEEEQKDIIEPLLRLKQNLIGVKTADKISKELYKFIIENCKEKEIEVESYNVVIEVLDEIADLFENEKLSFDTYIRLLKIGIQGKEIGQIPQTQDKVTIGDVNRSKTHKIRAIFIIGVNDGVFPSVASSEGFFNDIDRKRLKDDGIELAKGTLEKMYEENFNIYKSFGTAEEKVYISYPISNMDDAPLRKSTMISRIKKIFPNIKEKTYSNEYEILTKQVTFTNLLKNIENINEDWKEVYNWYKNSKEWSTKLEKALTGLNYTNIPEKINKENIQKLYGDTLYTTVSRLENYKSCAFSYYLKYGLKISSKEKMNINPMDTGSFMHDVIDTFFKQVSDIKSIKDDEMKSIIDRIIEEKLSLPRNYIFTLTAKYRTLVRRLKKVIFLSMKYIVESLKYSEFEVLQTELKFGDSDFPAIEIELEDGKKVAITGKIDRIDIAKTADGKYIRIIDYKSSTKDLELNKVISGLQLQLLTYVDAVVKKNNVEPAGALYFTLLEPKIINSNREISKDEIEEIVKKNYKMNGIVLADVNIVKMMDKNLEIGKSNVIPVELNSNGEINYKNSKTVTKEEFEALQKYTIKLIKQISKEILDGKINAKPYYIVNEKKTPCSYCEYKSICQFNPKLKGNDYFYIGKQSRQELLNQINTDVEK